MRILHTADLHIGQTLNGWSRDEEHRVWLAELCGILADREIDLLLISGDVFDNLNPSGDSQKLFYDALAAFRMARPHLQTVITSGNHDPAGRLEAPAALLSAHGCEVFGTMRRAGPEPDWGAHIRRIDNAEGIPVAVLAAVPFLRAADLPGLNFAATEDGRSPVMEAVSHFNAEIAAAAARLYPGLPLIAMGHLTCMGGTESEDSERRIMIGGEHSVPAEVFGPEYRHVALGHLHMPQSIDGGRIRYSGACFPMSVSEAGYRHGVSMIGIGPDGDFSYEHIPTRRPADFIRIPARGQATPEEFAEQLAALDLDPDMAAGLRPFLYAQITATGAASAILSEAQRLIQDRPLRLADIRILRRAEDNAPLPERPGSLQDTSPERLFIEEFRRVNLTDPEERHLAAFRDVVAGV